ncbi:MAG: AtzE family amidohydrolase [Chloroflexaceae bacterium]|nr:AtzE family amidohydrolase [Chloroflexaceae bacterium]
MSLYNKDAIAIVNRVNQGEVSATDVVRKTIAGIAELDPQLNCFTAVFPKEAIAQAQRLDEHLSGGGEGGPLAGVPFAVKNLFDVAGLTTLAGSKIHRDKPKVTQDAIAISRLRQAGAILVGTLNMDEYAYGFVTENSHYGATRNPRDRQRMAGGSSGGSAAAVAANLVPLTLGSDTNGSIRVPAAFCGVLGFKPTYGRLSRAGAALFVSSLDTIGSFARSVRDIAAVFDVLQGFDPRDPVCTQRPAEPCFPQLTQGIAGLKIAIADGYFTEGAQPEAIAAVAQVGEILSVQETVTLPEPERAQGAAYLITAVEGANQHLSELRSRPQDFDPATRDRFLAGALIPAGWYVQAQRFRRWYQQQFRGIWQEFDIILAPTTPCTAPLLGQSTLTIAGREILLRSQLGRFTQPLSLIGLPVLSFPVINSGQLPLGVQIVSAPYEEAKILRVAAFLERCLAPGNQTGFNE